MQYILDILQNMVYNQSMKGGDASVKNNRLKIARMEHDMNQEALANAVGVTRQTIGMIESGNYNPTLNLCIAICDVLGKTLDELFWIPASERDSADERKEQLP